MQETTCRQKLNDFMVESRWAGEDVLRDAALFTLMSMKPQKGEGLKILIDGPGKRKRGKSMDAMGFPYSCIKISISRNVFESSHGNLDWFWLDRDRTLESTVGEIVNHPGKQNNIMFF